MRSRSIRRGGLAWKTGSNHGTLDEDQKPIHDLHPQPANEYPLKSIPSANPAEGPIAQGLALAKETYVLDVVHSTKATEVV